MDEPKIAFTVTVKCKVALSDADLRFLEADINRRLYATLVQKIASIEFQRPDHGNS